MPSARLCYKKDFLPFSLVAGLPALAFDPFAREDEAVFFFFGRPAFFGITSSQ